MDVEQLRIELGEKSQAALARRLGVPVTYLSDLKAKRREVSRPFALAVERETGQPGRAMELLDGKAA